MEYSIVNNTTVKGKTDFWQYVQQLFGISLPEGIGLTGNGLSGKMQVVGDHFEATGIPVLPYDDKMNWNPFQIAKVTLRDNPGKGNKTGQTIQVVLPVSDEIICAQCHSSNATEVTTPPEDPYTVIQKATAGFTALHATTALIPGGRRNSGPTTFSLRNCNILPNPSAIAVSAIQGRWMGTNRMSHIIPEARDKKPGQ